MLSIFKKASCFIIAVSLMLLLLPMAPAWAEEEIMPPEGDSIESPFSPEDLIEADEVIGGEITPFGMSSSSYDRLMKFALQYKGWRYLWGGRYPSQGGFDCTGLVMHAYNNVFGCGFDVVYTNAERLYKNHCNYVSPRNARPGDLVFWKGTYDSINLISHVGIYCGGDTVYAAGDPIGYYKINGPKNIYGQPAEYFFASVKGLDEANYITPPTNIPEGTSPMYRMYNPNSGEHFYTASFNEGNNLARAGWDYEGMGWFAPQSSHTPVYRMYNPNAGDHHYTPSSSERDSLVRAGWNYEGIGWYSDDAKTAPLHRLYNPNAYTGAHHYTLSKAESDNLVRLGWRYEGIGWHGAAS